MKLKIYRLFSAAACVFALGIAEHAAAATIIIDDYVSPEQNVTGPGSGTVGPVGDLLMDRTVSVAGANTVNIGGGVVQIDEGSLNDIIQFIYVSDVPKDVTDGNSNNGFSLGIGGFVPLGVSIRVSDDQGNTGRITPLTEDPMDPVFMPFSAIDPDLGSDPLNFDLITEIIIEIQPLDLPGLTTSMVAESSTLLQGPFTATFVAPVPVPAALPLLVSGLLGLGVFARRRKNLGSE